jgi:hypothetical protein
MKSAEEWVKLLDGSTESTALLTIRGINAIQLDAAKAGMTLAAKLCNNGDIPTELESNIEHAILTARDNLTLSQLQNEKDELK